MSHDGTLQRALFALNGQRPQEAERIASDVLKVDPRHTRALHLFGCALLMQGRTEDAIAPLESAARGRFWLRPSEAARFMHAASPSASAPGTRGDKSPSHD